MQSKGYKQKRHKKIEVRGTLYPYEKSDLELREEENFAELCARDVTRKALRGIRETAREGKLKVGSSPLEPNFQFAMERAVQINEARESVKRKG